MKGLKIATIRGVPLKLHWSFLLVLGLIGVAVFYTTQSLGMAGYAVGLITLVFAFVLVHELAHVAVARHYGIPTREITLLPIGGISHMERIPEQPKQEAAISVAGPLVNVFFAIVLAPLVWWFEGGWGAFLQVSLLDPTDPSLLIDIFWLNVIMGAFNLLPAFPLDGGRVLRALLALKLSYLKATKVAADTGRVFGILFGLVGLLVLGNLILAIIGVFVYMGATAEERAATATAVFRRATVKEAMRSDPDAVGPGMDTEELVETSFRTHQTAFPVVDDDDRLVGLVDGGVLSAAAGRSGLTVRDIMHTRLPRLTPEDDLGKAYETFRQGELKAVPVFRKETLEEADEPTEDERALGGPRSGVLDLTETSVGRPAGILTVEDMERAFLYIQHREQYGADTRVASPMGTFGGRKRRIANAPRARHTRTASPDARPASDKPEVWVPVMDEEKKT